MLIELEKATVPRARWRRRKCWRWWRRGRRPPHGSRLNRRCTPWMFPSRNLVPGKASPSGFATPPIAAHMPLASAVRYPLRSAGSVPPITAIAPAETAPGAAAIPELGLDGVSPMQEPGSAWLAPLPVKQGTPVAPAVAQAFALNLAPVFPNGPEPSLPWYRFEPADGSAVPPPPRSFLAFANWTAGDPSERRDAWQHVGDFWNHAPRDLKLLLFAIPVLLGLALHPRLAEGARDDSSAAARAWKKNFQQAIMRNARTSSSRTWRTVRAWLWRRISVRASTTGRRAGIFPPPGRSMPTVSCGRGRLRCTVPRCAWPITTCNSSA